MLSHSVQERKKELKKLSNIKNDVQTQQRTDTG